MRIRLAGFLVTSALILGITGVTGAASAAAKEGPVGGAWSCVAHGTGAGDMEYTFNLSQAAEAVKGNFTAPAPDGSSTSHEVQNGSYKNGKLELHFDEDDGLITVTGGLDGKDAMKGDWTQGTEGGTWECKRGAATASAKH